MAIKKIEMRPEGTGDYADILYPKTSSDMVVDETSGKTVKSSITELEGTKTAFDAHAVDYVKHAGVGLSGGSANVYNLTLTPAPTAYVDNMCVVLRCTVSSTGASTLNVNSLGAKSLKKADGTNLVTMKANGVYTFRYSVGTGSFILQGDNGGGGDATPGDVKLGKTFTNDTGQQTGTFVGYGANDKVDLLNLSENPTYTLLTKYTLTGGDIASTATNVEFRAHSSDTFTVTYNFGSNTWVKKIKITDGIGVIQYSTSMPTAGSIRMYDTSGEYMGYRTNTNIVYYNFKTGVSWSKSYSALVDVDVDDNGFVWATYHNGTAYVLSKLSSTTGDPVFTDTTTPGGNSFYVNSYGQRMLVSSNLELKLYNVSTNALINSFPINTGANGSNIVKNVYTSRAGVMAYWSNGTTTAVRQINYTFYYLSASNTWVQGGSASQQRSDDYSNFTGTVMTLRSFPERSVAIPSIATVSNGTSAYYQIGISNGITGTFSGMRTSIDGTAYSISTGILGQNIIPDMNSSNTFVVAPNTSTYSVLNSFYSGRGTFAFPMASATIGMNCINNVFLAVGYTSSAYTVSFYKASPEFTILK